MKILSICKGLRKNTSGVNTFINNLKEYTKIEFIDLDEINKISFKNYDKIILNCFETLIWFNNNKDLIDKKMKIYYYTHIGDLIHKNFLDFDYNLEKKELCEKILKNNNIIFLTQTKILKKFLINKYKKKCYVLKEPLSKNIKILNNDKKYDFIIISSFYKRKNLDLLIKKFSNFNFKILFLTNNKKDIKTLCLRYNLKNFIIFQNIKNEKIFELISRSKCSINFSSIEVCPYGILESMFFTNVIINNNAIWSKCFFEKENIYRLNDIKIDKIKKIIKNNYFNYAEYLTYIEQTQKEWKNFEKY